MGDPARYIICPVELINGDHNGYRVDPTYQYVLTYLSVRISAVINIYLHGSTYDWFIENNIPIKLKFATDKAPVIVNSDGSHELDEWSNWAFVFEFDNPADLIHYKLVFGGT